MVGISFTGIGSGLQVNDIVEATVNAERVPYESRIARQQGAFTTDISAVGALKSALEAVTASFESLGDVDEYQQRSASGRDDFIGISSDKNAEIGNYSVKVEALASAHKLMSGAIDGTEAVGEGSLTIESGGDAFNVNVSATATLSEIRDAINDSAGNSAVSATIITDANGQHLVLNSKETGVENAIKITVDDTSDGNNTDNLGLSRLAYDADIASPTYAVNMAETGEAKDAQIVIDGTITATSSTNEFDDVIDGVNITAKKLHDVGDDISKVSIAEDNKNVAAGINTFIESFNALVDLSNQLGKSGKNADGELENAGVLAGDAMLRGVMSKIRGQFNKEFDSGDGNTLALSQLGVRTERDGKLSFDQDNLDDLLEKKPDAVQTFFLGDEGDNGFVNDMNTFVGFYTDSDGVMTQRIDSKNNQITKLDKDLEAFQLKMQSLEARLFAQYNAMDLMVSQLNSTGSYLMAQLDNMPGVVKSSE